MNKNVDIEKYTSQMDSNGYVIFGKDNCKYCSLAKQLLLHYKVSKLDIIYIKVNDTNERKALYNYINEKLELHVKTVPQIFYNGNYIGGYDSLIKFLS